MRRHILKEEMCLFPAAREHLPDATITRILTQFAAAPAGGIADGLQARAEELVDRYGPPERHAAAGPRAQPHEADTAGRIGRPARERGMP
ncbi:MAG: hypothetical protein HY906_18575 [Deltaproteobacteria bacterium]|nr:hypothetical protein [Deltaproteobacteria bacterium]